MKALIDHGVRFLLVVGYAVRFHGYERGTKDVDVLVSNDGANAKRLCSALISLVRPHHSLQPEQIEDKKRQINLASYGYHFEILTEADGVPFDEAYGRRSVVHCLDLPVPVIAKGDLITMKDAAGRSQDKHDVKKLLELA